jgi:hypothetical protein
VSIRGSRIILLLLAFAGAVHAWGPEGHKAIAKVALEELAKTNPAAAAHVKEILHGESIEDASVWPDDVRTSRTHPGRLADSEEGKAFNAAHPDNAVWHYVDLPLDVKSYGEDRRLNEEHDVVHMVGICAAVLEGKSDFLPKKQALRCLIHFVGDMHQPLHVGVGYFKFAQDGQAVLITDPEEASQPEVVKDNGANKLMLSKNLNLHLYWDVNLVLDIAPEVDPIADVLRKDVAKIPATAGAWNGWPEQWAQESVAASRQIYDNLTFGKRYPKKGNFWMVYVNFKSGAKEKFQALAKERLAQATRHLADMLGAIQWAK